MNVILLNSPKTQSQFCKYSQTSKHVLIQLIWNDYGLMIYTHILLVNKISLYFLLFIFYLVEKLKDRDWQVCIEYKYTSMYMNLFYILFI